MRRLFLCLLIAPVTASAANVETAAGVPLAARAPLFSSQSLPAGGWLGAVQAVGNWASGLHGNRLRGSISLACLAQGLGERGRPNERAAAFTPLLQELARREDSDSLLHYLSRIDRLAPEEQKRLVGVLDEARRQASRSVAAALLEPREDAPELNAEALEALSLYADDAGIGAFVRAAQDKRRADSDAALLARARATSAGVAAERERAAPAPAPAPDGGPIVYASYAMKQVMEQVRRVAPTRATVLIQGETGTGKDLIAEAVHRQSGRAKGPFVVINTASLPEELIESELFGYVKGSFTGATRDAAGRVASANGGTLFLDEIEAASPRLQPKLLRLLQNGEIQRVGDTVPRKVDVRVVAATNQDLLKLVKEGKFREDLYYRLEVFPIDIAPLRERTEDIPLLAEHFLRELSAREGVARAFSAAGLEALLANSWPGNARELMNYVERGVIMAESGTIEPEDMLLRRVSPPPTERMTEFGAIRPLAQVIAEVERRSIETALKANGGNITATARMLETDRRTLYRKIQEHGLKGVGLGQGEGEGEDLP